MDELRLSEIEKFYQKFQEASEENRKLIDDVEHRHRFVQKFEDFCISQTLERFGLGFDRVFKKVKYGDTDKDVFPFDVAYADCVGTHLESALQFVVPVKGHREEFVLGFRMDNADLSNIPALLAHLRFKHPYVRLLSLESGYLCGEDRYHLWVFLRANPNTGLMLNPLPGEDPTKYDSIEPVPERRG